MKPEQFIREYGPKFVNELPESATHVSGFTGQVYKDSGNNIYVWDGVNWHKSIYRHTRGMIPVSRLKQLAESLDLVESKNGINEAKEILRLVRLHSSSLSPESKRLAQAIRDHESIYGGGDE
ncbi:MULTISPECIES: hypothetical protein [Acinetobacter calcoaceticus/baumannii complex]|uniref:hypothetical protein n=1 Tax=Acinetobacter calcoaceticus/baumannii complex TaxID=909768 RepID=UPI002242E0B6|nr:hypothetical protein [Acinetobacter baumannii]MCW8533591.1 hypothetical protein [Acinetobacter baumannii]MCW8537366.1 hypothetical protein [Acinetobacter baumannii]MCW8544797.1 hypothetical protein [Acinetobacter baumannii]MCW8548565.1 hypothetical protein [Acinetobacter baumannii]MCW8559412.1 hypothetical protein [Acinetobacter baumannii]